MILLKVFFLNLINDIDNGFILSSLLQRTEVDKKKYYLLCLYAALILSCTRTLYVFIEKRISELPGIRMVSGIVILIIAIRLIAVKQEIRSGHLRILSKLKAYIPWFVRLIGLLVLTDFAICLDSVIMTAQLSDNYLTIGLGIFCSIFIILLFFRRLMAVYILAPWIQIVIAGLLTQIAVMGMSHDPVFTKITVWVQNFFLDTKGRITPKVMDIIALDSALVVIIIGLIHRTVNLFNKK